MNFRASGGLVAIVCAAFACSELPPDPAVDPARGDLLGATRDAVERSLAGSRDVANGAALSSSDALYAREAQRPAGIAARVAVLEALALTDRHARLEALDAARQESSDPLFRTYVDHLLEQDDAWFARALEHDAIWTMTAGFFNGVVATGYAVLNGNPIGVVKPLVNGVDGMIRDVPLDARDRKLAALKKRMVQKGEVDDDASYNLAKEIAELETSTVKEELWLARKALDRDRADVAAMHWYVAKCVRPADEDVVAVAGEIEEHVKARSARLDLALRVDPIESQLDFEQRDAWASIATSVVARSPGFDAWMPRRVLGFIQVTGRGMPKHSEDAPDDPAGGPRVDVTPEAYYAAWLSAVAWLPMAKRVCVDELAEPFLEANAPRSAQSDVLKARADLLRRSLAIDPRRRVASADAAHSSERSRFVWTGRRDSHDPLMQYAEARAALHRSFLDRIEPIFWVPATLFRGAINSFADPVNDQPLVDTLAWTARNLSPDDPRRADVLKQLARRLADRGNAEQAFAVAKAAEFDAAALAKYEHKAEEAEKERAEERAGREAALAATGATIPAYALAPYATRYGFSRDVVDGRRDNGEVAPRGVLVEGSKLVLDVEKDGVIERFEVTLDAVEARRMDALAREWGWRRRAASAETYEKLHGGWPVEMYAGIGASGVAAYPRLLPEGISAEERKLWE